MAKNETWRDPIAVAMWVMVAVVLWLLIMASPQLGRLVWEWTHGGASTVADPLAAPPWLVYGLVAAGVALVAVIVLCVWLRLGLWWLLLTVLVSSLTYALRGALPEPLGTVMFLVVPPIVAALVFKPKSYAPRD